MMESYAYFNGQFVPYSQAKVGIMTHALNYGTACFEGIRAYWSQDHFSIFRLRDHYKRLGNSARILKMALPHDVDELCRLTTELVAMNPYREDVYIRPMAYKRSEVLGVRLHNVEDGFFIFVTPFGAYLDTEKGIACCVSSWKRVDDDMIPARAKITGAYINSALAKTEAVDNGFDEAILLSRDGHVSEGSGENLFLVMNGRLVTPSVYENILVGITRQSIMEIASRELGIETEERKIDRTELYIADECFLTGTAGELAPVLSVDHRPVGSGGIGPISAKLQKLYIQIARGKLEAYHHWCTFVAPSLVETTSK
ncbi:MAG: branched-chain amino acid transaminase [Dehalococcoidia bacterium]|nr:branched-chain amino acid transaminase [Dehalococcoidia bacterium]